VISANPRVDAADAGSAESVAIDLPLKLLVREDDAGECGELTGLRRRLWARHALAEEVRGDVAVIRVDCAAGCAQ